MALTAALPLLLLPLSTWTDHSSLHQAHHSWCTTLRVILSEQRFAWLYLCKEDLLCSECGTEMWRPTTLRYKEHLYPKCRIRIWRAKTLRYREHKETPVWTRNGQTRFRRARSPWRPKVPASLHLLLASLSDFNTLLRNMWVEHLSELKMNRISFTRLVLFEMHPYSWLLTFPHSPSHRPICFVGGCRCPRGLTNTNTCLNTQGSSETLSSPISSM